MGTLNFQWLSNGSVITNATQTTYTLTQADVGKSISVKASYVDGLGNAESIISTATTNIANVNDAPIGNVTINGTTTKNQILTASNTLTDADGIGTITYQWLSNGVAIPNANQSSYQLTQADTGQNISVKASYTDLQNTAESVTSSNLPINKNNAPTGSVTIKGLATWGTTLSVTSTIKDADGIGKLSYSWQSDNGELSTSPTYTLAESDVETKVWVTLSYTDKKGSLEEEDSKPVDVTISTKPSAANDILTGTDKADKLSGLAGNDTLIGDAGSDKLTGGKGMDTFSFSSSDFYTVNSNGDLVFNKSVDTITDFNLKEHDVIDLGDLGQLTFFSSLNAAQDDMASLFYVKGAGKIYLNTNETDGFTPSVIIIISGKPAVNSDLTDWNYPI
jgi:Ca2+-binding RTX toxin-like protein